MNEENKQENKKKIRILALCDSPTSATGFAQVSRNILKGLNNTGKYQIDVIGINYNGDYYDREKFPFNIYPAMPMGYQDMYGRGRLINAIRGGEEKSGLIPGWDFIFTIQDPFVIEGLGLDFPFGDQLAVAREMWRRTLDPSLHFKWIGYFPVDSDLKENWVTRAIALPDYPVAYCDWGKDMIMKFERDFFPTTFNLKPEGGTSGQPATIKTGPFKDRLKVINHGVDTSVFHPLSDTQKKEFRKKFFKGEVLDDTFLVINVSRNQPRKDLTRTLKVFAEFKKKVPNSHLYLHCKLHDAGGSIHEMARNFDLVPGKDFTLPKDFDAGIGYSVDVVNKIYNIADLCITTTLGEGWGFITTEAMATKTPIIAPNITSIIDIFDSYSYLDPKDLGVGTFEKNEGFEKLRGIPVKAGSTSSEWICMGIEDNERVRPLTNVDDMVDKMVWAYANKVKVHEIVERAYSWVRTLSWDNIVKQWDDLFQKTYNELETERKLARAIDKTGRNDPCPCNSGNKYKNCHGSPEKFDKFKDWITEGGDKS